jgi:hypothetical protein
MMCKCSEDSFKHFLLPLARKVDVQKLTNVFSLYMLQSFCQQEYLLLENIQLILLPSEMSYPSEAENQLIVILKISFYMKENIITLLQRAAHRLNIRTPPYATNVSACFIVHSLHYMFRP